MKAYGHRGVMLAASLSALAGYVDAVGYMALGGFFVSFMSGNTTRLGVAVATGQWAHGLTALGLIVLFVVGVMSGSTLARRVPILLMVAGLLIIAAASFSAGYRVFGMAVVTVAMGVENAVFQRDGDVGIGLTYMTGTLVRVGQRLTTALHGGPRWDWIPYLALCLGLGVGAALGAASFVRFDDLALWAAAGVILCLTFGVWRAEVRASA